MLIRPDLLQDLFQVAPRGVLHVGAHEAEEAPAYTDLGWGPVVWVEMLPDKAAELRARFAGDPDNRVIEAAAWGSDGARRLLYRASNRQSSSLFRPQTHLVAHPEIGFSTMPIETRRLDGLLDPALPLDFLNIDCQGAELEVMTGLGALLDRFRWCYLEVNIEQLYETIPLRADVDRFLLARGFTRVVEAIHAECGWGDAFYVNGRHADPCDVFQMKLAGAAWEREATPVLDLAGDALTGMLRHLARSLPPASAAPP